MPRWVIALSAGSFVFLSVLPVPSFLSGDVKESFNIILCRGIILHVILCLPVMPISFFFLIQEPRELFIQLTDHRKFLSTQLSEGPLYCLVKSDFISVNFENFSAITKLMILHIHVLGLSIIKDVSLEYFNLCHSLLCVLDCLRDFRKPGKCFLRFFRQVPPHIFLYF